MLKSSKLVGFAATAKPEEARRFYEDVLELELLEDTPFALVFGANGTTLRLQKVPAVTAVPYTTLGWEVSDVGAAARWLAARGATLGRFQGLEQDDAGVWTAPDGTQVAWFEAPDGNMLSITQQAAQAESD